MKRSVGVTVWAVLLILVGVLTGAGALLALSAGPRTLKAMEEQRARLESLPTGSEPGEVSPEQAEVLRERFTEIMREVQSVLASPAVQVSTGISVLLGMAAFVAGIGLFLLKGWARTLVLWQAALSIPFGFFTLWASPQQRLSGAVLRFYEGLVEPAAQEHLRRSVETGQTVGQWMGFVVLLAWNGLLLWFFSRASVKAQFQQHV